MKLFQNLLKLWIQGLQGTLWLERANQLTLGA